MLVLIIFSSCIFWVFVHLIGGSLASLLMGVSVKNVRLFYGKQIFSFNIGVLPVTVGSIPFGGSVEFEDNVLNGRSKLVRTFLHCVGTMTVFLGSAVCISFDLAFHHALSGFWQIIHGSLAPLTVGKIYVEQFFGLAETGPFVLSLGILGAKISAYNMLPIFPSSTGQALLALFTSGTDSKVGILYISIGTIISLVMTCSWMIAIILGLIFY